MHRDIICITGSMASGTTTLTTRLSRLLSWEPVFSEEHIHQSPFYDIFLQFPDRWAFQNQVYFLSEYVNSYSQIIQQNNKRTLCLDYMIHEILVYTEAMMTVGYLNKEEHDLILAIFEKLSNQIPKPNLLVYVLSDKMTVIKRIKSRQRLHESIISEYYLEEVVRSFDRLLSEWKYCPIICVDSVKYNFKDDDSTLSLIASQVQLAL